MILTLTTESKEQCEGLFKVAIKMHEWVRFHARFSLSRTVSSSADHDLRFLPRHLLPHSINSCDFISQAVLLRRQKRKEVKFNDIAGREVRLNKT